MKVYRIMTHLFSMFTFTSPLYGWTQTSFNFLSNTSLWRSGWGILKTANDKQILVDVQSCLNGSNMYCFHLWAQKRNCQVVIPSYRSGLHLNHLRWKGTFNITGSNIDWQYYKANIIKILKGIITWNKT